jgi:hypothetical protein
MMNPSAFSIVLGKHAISRNTPTNRASYEWPESPSLHIFGLFIRLKTAPQ